MNKTCFIGDCKNEITDVTRRWFLERRCRVHLQRACRACNDNFWIEYLQTLCTDHALSILEHAPDYDRRYGKDNVSFRNRDGVFLIRHELTEDLVPKPKNGNWVEMHRFIVAERMGAPLEPRERVIHINGIKSDNRFSNLRLEAQDTISRATLINYYDAWLNDESSFNQLSSDPVLVEDLRWRLSNWQSKDIAEVLIISFLQHMEDEKIRTASTRSKNPDPHPAPAKNKDAASGTTKPSTGE